MVLHLTHDEGGFGVTFNDATKDAAFYTTTSRFVVWLGAFSQERQVLWLPKDDLRDSSSWSSPPLKLLRDIHSKLITTARRSVRRLSHRSTQGLVIEKVPSMVFRNRRRLPPSQSRSSTASMSLPLCGMRPLPPTLMLMSSRHSTGSPSDTQSLTALPGPACRDTKCLSVNKHTDQSGVKKAHDWAVDQLLTYFAQHTV